MKKRVEYMSLVLAAAVCLSLTACGSESEEKESSKSSESNVSSENTASENSGSDNSNTDRPISAIDDCGTVERDGVMTDVCVCHDLKAVYLYINDDKHELFDTAMLPTDEIYDKDWSLGNISFDDITGDNNSDLQVNLCHGDMSESHIVWEWDKDKGFTYQPNDSRFYEKGVIMDPPDDAVYDLSMYEGLWQSDRVNLYENAYLQFDAKGNFTLYSADGEIDKGYLWYDEAEELVFTNSEQGGAIDDGIIGMEGDLLNISTCGYFKYLDGRGGEWQGDGGSNWDDEGR